MKKLLGLLGSLGLVSTSATAVVSFVKIPKDNDFKTIAKEDLTKLIDEAKTLATENKDKNNEAYQALHKAIGEANGVLVIYQNETENPGVLKEVHEKLTKAIEDFNKSENFFADTSVLGKRIEDANKILEAPVNNSKGEGDKNRLKEAISAAQALKDENLKISEQNKVNTGVQTLQSATLAFFNATDQPANIAELEAEIAKAEKTIIDTPKNAEAIAKLREVIELDAKAVIKANYSSSDQKYVDEATTRLKQAIEDYLNAGQPVIPEEDVDLTTLRDKIKEAKEIASADNRKNKPLLERIKIEEAIGHAEGIIAGKPVIGQEQKIRDEVKDLQTAIDNFIKAENQKANLDMLKANITLAEGVVKNHNKKPDAVTTFKAAIEAAKKLQETKPDIDKQGDIDKGAETIWQATLAFLNSANRININHVIHNGFKLDGVLKDVKKQTISDQLKVQFPNLVDSKEKGDFSIGTVTQANNNHKSSAELTGENNYHAKATVYFVLDLKNIEPKLNEIVNSKTEGTWTATELKAEIEKNNLDVKDGLKVTQIDSDPASELAKFKITTNNHYDYSGYAGEIIITQDLRPHTIYIDAKTGKEVQTDQPAPEGTKKIIYLGWDKNTGKAHKAPSTIEEVPNYISPKITDLTSVFEGAKNFNGDISKWDTSNVTTFDSLFRATDKFNGDISNWNTSKVTSMKQVFDTAKAFNKNIKTAGNSWNVSNVTDMSIMFFDAKAFNYDISNWDVKNVKNHDKFAERANPNWKKAHQPQFKKA